jgi:hypothetical protein
MVVGAGRVGSQAAGSGSMKSRAAVTALPPQRARSSVPTGLWGRKGAAAKRQSTVSQSR